MGPKEPVRPKGQENKEQQLLQNEFQPVGYPSATVSNTLSERCRRRKRPRIYVVLIDVVKHRSSSFARLAPEGTKAPESLDSGILPKDACGSREVNFVNNFIIKNHDGHSA